MQPETVLTFIAVNKFAISAPAGPFAICVGVAGIPPPPLSYTYILIVIAFATFEDVARLCVCVSVRVWI